MLRRVVRHVRTNVSEPYASSIFRPILFHPEEASSTFPETQVIYQTARYTTEAPAFVANSPHAPRIPLNYTQLTRKDSHNGYQNTGLDDPGFESGRDKRSVIYLFSRLYNVPTSSCAHLTIILSSSSSCLCHFSLLALIPFLPSVLFFKMSTTSLGPIQPAIRCVKCFFPEDKAARARS